MTTPVILAVLGGLLALAANWILRRRDEARLGGAAERRLRAEFQNACEVLQASAGTPDDTWLSPGLRIPVWRDQFDRLVPRFLPAEWDRINGAVEALDRLQGQVETRTPPGQKVTKQLDESDVTDTRSTVARVLQELNRRHNAWEDMRPWLKEGLAPRVFWRLLGLAIVVVMLYLAAFPVREALTANDHTDAAAVQHELREMDPDATFVHCTGDDSLNRWHCKVATKACEMASSQPQPCPSNLVDMVDLDVEADGNTKQAEASLTRLALERANAPKPPTSGQRVVSWVRKLFSKERPVDLTAMPAT